MNSKTQIFYAGYCTIETKNSPKCLSHTTYESMKYIISKAREVPKAINNANKMHLVCLVMPSTEKSPYTYMIQLFKYI